MTNKVPSDLLVREYGRISDGLISVIIPVYNEEICIEDCLRSLLKQSFGHLEIIVVDDGSTDRTVSICEAFGVEVYRQTHRGMAAARNFGARKAKGSILILVDADMIFAPEYVGKLIAPIINGEAIATDHWNERVANWDNPWARCQTWFQKLPDRRRQTLTVPEHSGQYRAVRKDFFLNSGGLTEEEGYRADTSLARRTGVFAEIIKDAICYHRNIEGPRELFRETRWHGRQVAFIKERRLRRCVATILIHRNPLVEIVNGIYLSIIKKEHRMIFYSIFYIISFDLGIIDALFSKSYQK
jgi:glycosyltransferase involved in cell wall biosynthesis